MLNLSPVWKRRLLTLLLVVAFVIAFLVIGITEVSDAFGASPTPAQTAVTPADPPH